MSLVTTAPSYVPPAPSTINSNTVSTFTHSVGIITPPHEIALIIDRTAEFVKKLGEAFEQEIKNRDGTKKKFAFLFPASPYHAYYRARVQYGADIPPELMSQDVLPPVAAAAIATTTTTTTSDKPKEIIPKVLTLQDRLKAEIEKMNIHHIVHETTPSTIPETTTTTKTTGTTGIKNIYTVKPPEIYSPLDIEILKLTALYGARNGKTFIDGLKLRERYNRQFSFLQSNNLLFALYQQYHDAYLTIMIPPNGMINELRERVEKGGDVIYQWLLKAQMEKVVRARNAKATVDEEAEAEIMSAIDWQNFVIVETINFDAADESFLPQPKTTVEEMLLLLTADQQQDGGDDDVAQDMDMDMDMDEENDEEEQAAAKALAEAEKKRQDIADATALAMAAAKQRYQIDEEELEIRRDYNENRVRELANTGVKFQKCPVCGDEIAIEDLSEHIRIELLDPRWKEQKQILLDKQRESSYAPDNTIVQNLARLAKKRQAQNALGEMSDDTKDEDKFDLAKLTAAQHEKEKERLAKEQAVAAKLAPKVAPPVAPRAAVAPRPVAPVAPVAPPRPVAAPVAPVRPAAGIPVAAPPVFAPVAPPAPVAPRPPVAPAPPAQPAPPKTYTPYQNAPVAEPPSKKPRVAPPAAPAPPEKKLATEEEWLAQHPGPCTVHISVPNDPENSKFHLNGQTFDVTATSLSITVLTLKEQIVSSLEGLGANKIKLQIQGGLFLAKDNQSLASYNVQNGQTLVVGLKERGGKAKK